MDVPQKALMKTRFQKVRRIGEGAFGSAILAMDKETNQLCVIKRLKTRLHRQQEVQSAINEINSLSRLRHENIVSFYLAWIEDDGRLHLCMEYCEGGDLHQYLESYSGKVVPEEKVRLFVVQLLLGLEHMHRHHVIHRDIKLQNIFLTGNHSVVKVGDFGLSKLINSTDEAARTLAGTPYYFSPEIAGGKEHTRKTDVWSLGVMLYQLLTREHPFRGNGIRSILESICRGQPEPVSLVTERKFNFSYSQELCDTLSKMLTKDASDRPSAADLLSTSWLKELSLSSPWKDLGPGKELLTEIEHEAMLLRKPIHPVAMVLTRPRVTLNVRKEPNLESTIVGKLNTGDVVRIAGGRRVPNANRQPLNLAEAAIPGPKLVLWYRLVAPLEGWCIAELSEGSLFERAKQSKGLATPKVAATRMSPVNTGLCTPRGPTSPLKRRSNVAPTCVQRSGTPHYASPLRRLTPTSAALNRR